MIKLPQITLVAARVNANLKQKDAAHLLGIHPQTLSHYEKDSSNIPYELLKHMCDLYGMKPEYIFLGKKYEKNRTRAKA